MWKHAYIDLRNWGLTFFCADRSSESCRFWLIQLQMYPFLFGTLSFELQWSLKILLLECYISSKISQWMLCKLIFVLYSLITHIQQLGQILEFSMNQPTKFSEYSRHLLSNQAIYCFCILAALKHEAIIIVLSFLSIQLKVIYINFKLVDSNNKK